MKFGLIFIISLLFLGNSISQVVDQTEFSGLLESAEYAEINCYMPHEIYESEVFRATFTAIPKSNSGSSLIIQSFYAYFSDSTLFLSADTSASLPMHFSGYLNEHKLTLFSPALSFINAQTYPVVLTRQIHQNEIFRMHKNYQADTNIQYITDVAEPIVDEHIYASFCDPHPSFQGGDSVLISFINSKVIYPAELVSSGICGRVYVRFTINEDGSISDITIARGIHKLLDEEAIRVISIMPKWNPGMLDGKVVRCEYVVPVRFIPC
jgi:TonB family protein